MRTIAARPDMLTPSDLAMRIAARAREHWGESALLVGRHRGFVAALERLERLADSDAAALITGETGTGKELFARGLYLLSRRRGRPFLRVNCAQYHDGQLMASELFGHKKGSFTGALRDHVGLFESANGGMVFLDEVTELTLSAQAMLLRVLSEGEIVPVGESVPRRVNVRVVAASSADVSALVQAGRFRLDLYYRLRGMQLRVPPLRERGHDWELIGDYYLRDLAASRHHRKHFSRDSLAVLGRYQWPGNVREVKALVDSGFHLSEGSAIEPEHFLESLEEATRIGQLQKVPLIDMEADCYERLTKGEGNFWTLVHGPYLERELSRGQVRGLIARGLVAAGGSYKRLLPLFGLAESEYPRFMDFLRHHKLKPPSS